jgi:putative membrane protein
MFVTYRGTVLGLIGWQWRLVLLYCAFATVITVADRVFFHEWINIGGLPLGVMGGAIGIFVSFRTNSCYDRWWEGRRLWGQLVNSSRHLATQILTYADAKDGVSADEEREIVRRHIGYVHVLRCLLRAQDPWVDPDVARAFDEPTRTRLRAESNPTHAILHAQTEAIMRLERSGRLDGFRLQALDRTIAALLDVQGGCERIKRTPFPPGYGFLATRLIGAFAILLPMGIVDQVGWATIPLTVLVCLGFALINEVGRVLEDPFTLFWPALPLFALSMTIEVNLRQRLGDRDLPAIPTADSKGILM